MGVQVKSCDQGFSITDGKGGWFAYIYLTMGEAEEVLQKVAEHEEGWDAQTIAVNLSYPAPFILLTEEKKAELAKRMAEYMARIKKAWPVMFGQRPGV